MEKFLQQLINGLTIGGFYAVVALGYTMVYGVLKLINFAHGDVYMVGAFTGYKTGVVTEYIPNSNNPLVSEDPDNRGVPIGAEVGCQYQSGHWVFGVAADGAWTRLTGQGVPPNPAFTVKANENWFGTVRGKIGIANDHRLLYVTGGWAWSEWTMRTTYDPAGLFVEDTKTIDGFVVGAGMDLAFANHWLFNVEFLYMNYGKNLWYNPPDTGACNQNATPFITVDFSCFRDIKHQNLLFKVGLKYLFQL